MTVEGERLQRDVPQDGGGGGGCPGCRYRPHAHCAACGAPATIALDASSSESEHSLALCARCHATLLEVRRETADDDDEPLVYLPLAGGGIPPAPLEHRPPPGDQPIIGPASCSSGPP
jgi:hypothetical protein